MASQTTPLIKGPLPPDAFGAAVVDDVEQNISAAAAQQLPKPDGAFYYDGSHTRPTMRGWIHVTFAIVTLIVGVFYLVRCFELGHPAILGGFVYVGAHTYMFCTSGCFHTYPWSTKRGEMKCLRADHLGTHFVAYGSLVPTYLILLGETGTNIAIISFVAMVICATVSLKMDSDYEEYQGEIDGIPWSRIVYVMTYAISALPGFCASIIYGVFGKMVVTEIALLFASIGAFVVGAIIYSGKLLDPWPYVFGYLEIWHTFTSIGVALGFCMNIHIVTRCLDDASLHCVNENV
jgi:channel protein (hemolysin III family)